MQEFLQNVRQFLVRTLAHAFGSTKRLLSRLGPSALVLGVGVVALIMGGMFVFGSPAFGLQDADPDQASQSANQTAQVLPSEAVASISKLDSDEDGLRDLDEIRYRTDAKNPDTDGDGYKDGEEVAKGFNPNSLPGVKPEDDKLAPLSGQQADTSFLDLLGYKPVDSKVDGLNVGGLGGLPQEDLEKIQNQILPSGERLGELEFDQLMNSSSRPLTAINPGSVKVSKATDKAAQEKYYQEAVGVLVRFNPFPRTYKIETLLVDLQTNNRDQLEKIKLAESSISRELAKLTVPQPLVAVHTHALGILQGIREMIDRVLASNGSPDDTLYGAGRTIFLLGEIGSLLKTLAAVTK